jgi:tripartite-type tricarboxylate transporter receptor subunit TctC
VKVVETFGPADIGARLFAGFAGEMGAPVVVENKPGGDGTPLPSRPTSAPTTIKSMFSHPADRRASVHVQKLPYNPAELILNARVSKTILAVAVVMRQQQP